MPKVKLDMSTFKALASSTRLDILRALDGKKMSLKDISKVTRLNKATLHEHLAKLNEAGLVKRSEREGHKWVYYKLTWKGEGLLHPENTKIVVMFTMTFITLAIGVISLINYIKGEVVGKAVYNFHNGTTALYEVTRGRIGYGATSPTNYPTEFSDSFDYSSAQQIAEVPIQNQTISQLSKTLIENSSKTKGVVGNVLTDNDVSWCKEVSFRSVDCGNTLPEELYIKFSTKLGAPSEKIANEAVSSDGEGGSVALSNSASNVPDSMVAIVHDPAFQYIAIACIVIFSILICFSVWRLYKNRKPKL